jgi:hypothetical protein
MDPREQYTRNQEEKYVMMLREEDAAFRDRHKRIKSVYLVLAALVFILVTVLVLR